MPCTDYFDAMLQAAADSADISLTRAFRTWTSAGSTKL